MCRQSPPETGAVSYDPVSEWDNSQYLTHLEVIRIGRNKTATGTVADNSVSRRTGNHLASKVRALHLGWLFMSLFAKLMKADCFCMFFGRFQLSTHGVFVRWRSSLSLSQRVGAFCKCSD